MASSLGKPPQPRDSDPPASLPSGEPPWALFADGVRLVALRALGDAALADDIAQEAVTRAIAGITSNRDQPIEDLGGFVYGIARHLIADVHRTSGRTLPLDAVPEVATPSASALDATIAEEDRRRIRAALNDLATADRGLLWLFFVEGLGAEDIGRRLNETAVNIRKRKSRALERLRRVFERHDGHPKPTDSR